MLGVALVLAGMFAVGCVVRRWYCISLGLVPGGYALVAADVEAVPSWQIALYAAFVGVAVVASGVVVGTACSRRDQTRRQ